MEDLIIKIFEKHEIAVTLAGISFGFSLIMFFIFLAYILIKEGKDE